MLRSHLACLSVGSRQTVGEAMSRTNWIHFHVTDRRAADRTSLSHATTVYRLRCGNRPIRDTCFRPLARRLRSQHRRACGETAKLSLRHASMRMHIPSFSLGVVRRLLMAPAALPMSAETAAPVLGIVCKARQQLTRTRGLDHSDGTVAPSLRALRIEEQQQVEGW
jgi:hypothetical protein